MTKQRSNEVSNEELLKRYQDSDLEAFKIFYQKTKHLVFSFLLMKLRSQSDAEEVLQDTYFRVHRYILTYDSSKAAIPWLMTIARNSLIDLVKDRIPSANIDPDTFYRKDDDLEGLEIKQSLENILAALKPEDRSFLEKRIFDDESYEELGKSMGITAENARQRFSRLLKKVKASFNS